MSENAGASPRRFLPYGRQTIEPEDVAAVAEAVTADYLTTGPMVDRFEAAFESVTDAPFAAVCNSGTAALHLAMMALGLGPGDVVLVPTLTFLATANAARYVGAEIVFTDVDARTGLPAVENLEAAIARAGSQRVRALTVVQLNGQSADMEAIANFAKARDLQLVEDACHALGAEQYLAGNASAKVGACARSDMACFSLHPVKGMTTGEGGVVTTKDPVLAERLKRLRNHGMSRNPATMVNRDLAFDDDGKPNPWYYEMTEFGYNYRLPDLLCALGVSQLGRVERFVARRQEIAAIYDRLLKPLAPRITPVPRVPWSSNAFHLYAVHIDFAALGRTRAQVMARLVEEGIGTQVHYLPVHRQPYYTERYGVIPLPGADAYYRHCLSLPIFPTLQDDEVERVAAALASL
jgi:UDP-4-amino-4,6-dideoxy-N-acetyl-beta-L-altrosamine transaminase